MGDGHVDCGELPRGLVLDSWTGEGGRGERRQRKEDPGAGRGDPFKKKTTKEVSVTIFSTPSKRMK